MFGCFVKVVEEIFNCGLILFSFFIKLIIVERLRFFFCICVIVVKVFVSLWVFVNLWWVDIIN